MKIPKIKEVNIMSTIIKIITNHNIDNWNLKIVYN